MKTITILITLIWITGCSLTKSSLSNNNEPELARQDSILATGWYYIVDNDNGYKRTLEKDTGFYYINPTPIATAKHFTKLEISEDNWKNVMLVIRFDKKGTKAWSDATKKYIGKHLALIIENKLIVTPKVNSQITAGVSALSAWCYNRQDLENFKAIIEKEK